MANVTVNGVWYSTAYSGWMHTTWAAFAGYGTSNTGNWYNYRTKIKFTTGSFGGKFKRLIVSATPNQNSSPGYTTAVLTKEEIDDDKILNTTTMQSDTALVEATIQYSYAYNSTREGAAYAGKSNRNTFYYILNTDIEKNTTYYLYIRRGGPSGQGTSGFVGFNVSSLSVELPSASFEPYRYEVKFDPNGGSVSSAPKYVNYNSTYGVLPTPTRAGYEFLGWYTHKEGGSPVASTTKTLTSKNSDVEIITLFAHWGKNSYTITIDAGDGKYINNNPTDALKEGKYSCNHGTEISLATPIKTGHLLAAWWTTPASHGQIQQPIGYAIGQYTSVDRGNFSKVINKNGYTNYKWTGILSRNNLAWNYITIAKYPVSANETITISGLIRVNKNSSDVVLNLYHGAEKNDWRNHKWSTKAADKMWKYFTITRTFDSATTAYFEIYTGPLQNVSGDIDFDLKAISISRSNGQVVPTEITVPTEDISIAPIWTPITYYLEYNGNGGVDPNNEMKRQDVSYGTYTYLLENKFTRPGHVFKGWHVQRKSDGKWLYATPNNITSGWYELDEQPEGQILRLFNFGNASGHDTEVMNDTLTYYAQWEKQLTLAYYVNGSVQVTIGSEKFDTIGKQLIKTETYKYEDTLLAGLLNPDMADLTFEIRKKGYNYTRNWKTDTGVTISDSFAGSIEDLVGELGEDAIGPDGVVNLFAEWDPIDYNVTYDLDDGTLLTGNYQETVAYGSQYTLLASWDVTKWGYKLAHWQASYTDDSGNKRTILLESARSFTWRYTSNLELKAIWKPVNVLLKFYYNRLDNDEYTAIYGKGFDYNDELPSVKDLFEEYCMPHHKMIGWKCYNPDNGEYYILSTDKTAAWDIIFELSKDGKDQVKLFPIIEPRYKILYIDSEGNEKKLAMILYNGESYRKIYPYFKEN